jgi:hypothetical protein
MAALGRQQSALDMDAHNISHGAEYFEIFQCGICFFLSKDPVYSPCCGKINCSACFKDCQSSNSHCPFCRSSSFKSEELNKLMKRLYNSIQFFCSYNKSGCTRGGLTAKEAKDHEKHCEYNPKGIVKCKKCFVQYIKEEESKHDCLKMLSEAVKTLTKKIDENKKKECFKEIYHGLK